MVLKCFKSSERPSDSQGRSPAKPMPLESKRTATTISIMNGHGFVSTATTGSVDDEEAEAVVDASLDAVVDIFFF